MIDTKKRKTLKGMAAVAGATAVSSLPALADIAPTVDTAVTKVASVRQVWPPVAVKSPVEVTTRMSAVSNDIEVVLTNKSNEVVTVTQMSPAKLTTPRGTFALDEFLHEGPRQLAAGESLHVPLQRHAIDDSAGPLQHSLRAGLTVTTQTDQQASVSYEVVA